MPQLFLLIASSFDSAWRPLRSAAQQRAAPLNAAVPRRTVDKRLHNGPHRSRGKKKVWAVFPHTNRLLVVKFYFIFFKRRCIIMFPNTAVFNASVSGSCWLAIWSYCTAAASVWEALPVAPASQAEATRVFLLL